MAAQGLYIHIPFCEKRCHYCDFNTYEGQIDLRERYVEALLADLRLSSAYLSQPLKSIFFGGGTPSLMLPSQIGQMVEAVREQVGLRTDVEISLEANPGSATLENFQAFRAAGINRISMGFQAYQDRFLLALGRIHDHAQSELAFRLARQAGFDNISIDLMFGLPEQSLQDWLESLRWGLNLQPDHLSFYGLTLEPGTRFFDWHQRGELQVPGEDLQADMYEQGLALCEAAGLAQYEISNFSRPGREAQHNCLYWQNAQTLGLGAGAWSYLGGERSGREKMPSKYIEACLQGRDPRVQHEILTERAARAEAASLALRTLAGIDLKAWKEFHGTEFSSEFASVQAEMARHGLLTQSSDRLQLTPKGRSLANVVFEAFL